AITTEAKKLNKAAREAFIAKKRKAHFAKYPKVAKMQKIINEGRNDLDSLIELLPALPYAKFNLESFARELGFSDIKEVFATSLKNKRIAILSEEQIKRNKISGREYAGECFAKKNSAHGLYSDSSIFIWLRSTLDPFTMV